MNIPENEKASSQTYTIIALSLLGMIAEGLHFVYTASGELTLDERASWWVASRGLTQSLFNTAPYPPHPLSYGAISLMAGIWGDSPLVIRLSGLLFLTGSLFLTLKLAAFLITDTHPPESVRGSLYISAFLFLILYSTGLETFFARSYQISAFLSLAAVYFCLIFIRSKNFPSLALSLLSAFGAVLNQPVFIFYMPGCLFLLNLTGQRLKRPVIFRLFAITMLLSAASAGCLVSYFAGVSSLVRHSSGIYSFAKEADIWLALAMLQNTIFLLPFMLTIFVMKMSRMVKTDYAKYGALFLWGASLPAGLYVMSYILKTNFLLERYAFFSGMIWVVIGGSLAADILTGFADRKDKSRMTVIFLSASMAALVLMTNIRTNTFYREAEGWQETTQCIAKQTQSGPPLIVLFPGHVLSLQSRHSRSSQDYEGWLAPLLYRHTPEKYALALLTLEDNSDPDVRLAQSIKSAAGEARTIALTVYRVPYAPDHAVAVLKKELESYGYLPGGTCHTGHIDTFLFERSDGFH